MKVSYIDCDFCHASTLTDKEAVMFTNIDMKAIGIEKSTSVISALLMLGKH